MMAKKRRKKMRGEMFYRNYEDAMRQVGKFLAEGDDESEEFQVAIEEATQYFLRDNRGARYNRLASDCLNTPQNLDRRKFLTVLEIIDKRTEEDNNC